MTPHRFCLLNDAHLLAPIVIANLAIAYAYIRIPIALIKLVGRLNLEPETREAIRLSWAFILSCAVTHLVSILVLFIPAYRLEAVILAARQSAGWFGDEDVVGAMAAEAAADEAGDETGDEVAEIGETDDERSA